jgi:hypothetical protein
MTEEEINQFFLDNRTKSADTKLTDIYNDPSICIYNFMVLLCHSHKLAQKYTTVSRIL